jgi:DNA-binding protein H-NS
MASYTQLQAQIEKLQKEADAARKREIAETIANIKLAIKTFGLTAEDLGLDSLIGSKGAGKRGRKAGRSAAVKAGAAKAGAKRGGKPGRPAKRAAKAGAKKSKAGSDKRSVVAPKYRDAATGMTWTGRGKQPKWLASHIKEGKALADFAI